MSDFKLQDFWVIIPAAGIGQRMQAEQPKQYLPLLDATVIEHTLAAFLCDPRLNIRQIVVALHSEDQWFNGLPFKHLSAQQRARIVTMLGGKERSDTVLAALQFLKNNAAANDWVFIHDAARPCLRSSSILDVLSAVDNDPVGGMLAVPASDTLKQVDHYQVSGTLERQTIWHAQTPQCFRYGLIMQALQQAQKD